MVIDLIGYRRHGHSEVDDPTVTQPLLYKAIKDHPPLWEIYAEDIGVEDVQATGRRKVRAELEAAQKKAKSIRKKPLLRELPSYWNDYKGGRYKPEYEVDTGLSAEELQRNHREAHDLSRGLPHPSQGQEAAGAAGRDGRGQAPGGLRHGRSSGASAAW